VSPKAAGEPPWANIGARLKDLILAVEIDEIDRKSHREGVNGLTGNDPEPFAVCQAFAPEQALAAAMAVTGELHTVSELGAAGDIMNLQAAFRRTGAPLLEARQNRCEFEWRLLHQVPSIRWIIGALRARCCWRRHLRPRRRRCCSYRSHPQ